MPPGGAKCGGTPPHPWARPPRLKKSEGSDGPDAYEGAADDLVAANGTEEGGVLRIEAVVAEDPIRVGGHGDRGEGLRLLTLGQIGLAQLAVVDEDLAVTPLDDLARPADHALDEVLD